MRIGILGGTFDPIHLGHLNIARAAAEQFKLNRVLFVPAKIPPHKEAVSVLASSKDRLEMVRLAISANSSFELCELEFNREGPSYTIDTLDVLKKEHLTDELFLIMGADSLPQIPTWKDPERIPGVAHLLVATRPGYPDPVVTPELEGSVSFIQGELFDISASEIRKKIGEKEANLSDVLNPKVLQYIQEHQLYRNKEN